MTLRAEPCIPGLHDHHVHLRSAAAGSDLRPRWACGGAGSKRPGPCACRRRCWQRRLDQGCRLPRGGRGTAGPRGARRGVAAGSGPRSAPQWRAVDAELGGAGQGGTHRPSRWAPSQRRSKLVGYVAAQRRRTCGGQQQISAYGVTGVTDATPDFEVSDIVKLMQAHRHGEFRQRVHCLAPGKRILHDVDLDHDELTAWIAERHAADAPVAVHCVTAAQLVMTLSALREAGTTRRTGSNTPPWYPTTAWRNCRPKRHGRDPAQLRRRAR